MSASRWKARGPPSCRDGFSATVLADPWVGKGDKAFEAGNAADRMGASSNGDDEMSTTIKVRFSGGVLKPLEELALEEGQELTVTIVALPSGSRQDWLEQTAGAWAGLVDAGKLKRDIYESRLLVSRQEPHL
jgi:predicted DNA-binding antitoxin AbrB/MazE fold protein